MSNSPLRIATRFASYRRAIKLAPAAFETLEARRMLAADVLMYHNDLSNTGQNLNEALLTPANVKPSTFGKLFNIPVDGAVYAQPLYKSNLVIPGNGTHNVLFVATEHDSVYAFDADNGAQIWKTSFIDPANGITTVPSGNNLDTLTNDIVPEVGITGTPVIDATSKTIFVLARTKEVSGNSVSYVQRLHALDITTGLEKQGGPVVITTSVPGIGDGSVNGIVSFDALKENNRCALTLANGVVYAAFASLGDNEPYHGWILGYNASNIQQQVAVFNANPDGYHTGIWMSGAGLPVDSNGNLFASTGDGDYLPDSPNGGDWGDSLLELAPGGASGLAVTDSFTPRDQLNLNATDKDFGSGAPLLLPNQPGAHPHELVIVDKLGEMFLVDRDNLGGFNASANQVIQDMPGAFVGGFGEPAYFNGALYFAGTRYGGFFDQLKEYTLSNGLLSSAPIVAPRIYGYPGASPSISANGDTNGIVWTIDDTAYFSNPRGPAALVANNAADITQEIYNSSSAAGGRDTAGTSLKFNVPTVANGHVYVAVNGVVTVYGLFAAPMGVSAAAGNAKVNLSWAAAGGASSYRVYRGTSPGGQSETPLASGLTSTTFSDTTAVNGTKYYYKVTAVYDGAINGGTEGARSVEVATTPQAIGSAIIAQIDTGSASPVGSYSADTGFTGGTTGAVSNTITTAGVTNPAPVGVYQSERYGKNFTYSKTGHTPGATYTVRLHFAEIWFTAAGQRTFNVSINGSQVLTNFDLFATAGGRFKANVQQFTTTASAGGAIDIAFNGVIDNAKINGIEILQPGAAIDQPPAIATAASVNPSILTGNTANLSVLGADDAGEGNLTYTWATTSAPVGGNAIFGANGTNAAKNTSVVVNKAGVYVFAMTTTDALGQTATSATTLTVNQIATSMSVSPSTATIGSSVTQQLVATAFDQFGASLFAQPEFTWSVGGGSIGGVDASGAYTSPASGSGTASVNVSGAGLQGAANLTIDHNIASTFVLINAGGSVAGSFVADTDFGPGGTPFSTAVSVDTTGVVNPAPQAVYQTERYGANFTYTIPDLVAGARYTVRLHFAETHWTTVGARKFNVAINGAAALTNFDIFAKVGANKADVEQFTATASASGTIAIAFKGVADNAKIDGIEVFPIAQSIPAAPSGLAATPATGQVTLNWNASTGATSYNLYRSTSAGAEVLFKTGVTSPYIDAGLTNGTTYFYKVTAVNSSGESLRSTEASAKPAGGNQPPTFVTPLTAAPNPVFGNGVSVSALGGDDGGEANLSYTWAFTSQPAGSSPRFDINGYNGAKRTLITFNKAGAYTLKVTAADIGGLSATSSAQIVVNQVAEGIAISPQGAALKNGATQQFSGIVIDQFGNAMPSQPGLTWSLASGSVGKITAAGLYTAPTSGGGTATVRASGGGFNASVTMLIRRTVLAIDAGGPAVTPYSADASFIGGATSSTNANVNTSGIDAAAPLAVYQTERNGTSFSYNLTNLASRGKFIVRLHFAETAFSTIGARVFNVNINGSQVLSNFDIFKKVGANKADVEQFAITATPGGVITVAFTAITGNAKINGIEVIAVPFAGSVIPSAVGTIEAENFDNGGQGIAYNDSTVGNQSGSYRNTDVNIEPTSDGGPEAVEIPPGTGGLDVNHITPGEWLAYTLSVPSTGKYDVQFRVSSVNGGFLHLEQDGVNVTGAVHIPNTFSTDVWQSIAKTGVSLTAGTHVFKLVFDSADNNGAEIGNINNFTIRQALPITNVSWASAAANPFASEEGQGAVVNGKLYTFGGLFGQFFDATGRVEVYDPANNTWATRASTMPDAVTHSPTVVVGTKIWFIGGYIGQHPGLATARVQIYDTIADTWSDGPALPQAMGASAAAIINNVIYTTGGDNPTRTAEVGNTYALDLNNLGAGWIAKASLASPRDHIGGVALNGKFYVAGGQTGPDGGPTLSDELDIYDPATNTWTRGANLPSPVSQINAATLVLNGKIIVAGGEISHNLSSDQVFSYDPVLNRWTILSPLPGARRAGVAGAINGQIIFTSGWDFSGRDHVETYIGTLS